MIRFFSSSILVLLLFSCKANLPNLEGFQARKPVKTEYAWNPYFKGKKAHIYRAKISAYGNQLSGILALRKLNDSLHRAAFMNEFGSTLLDVSYSENAFKKNYAIDKLDKKFILEILVDDFRLLTLPKRKVIAFFSNTEKKVVKTTARKGFVYYFYNLENKRLLKLVKTSKRKKKTSVFFDIFKNQIPQHIQIKHHNLKLNIELNALTPTYAD